MRPSEGEFYNFMPLNKNDFFGAMKEFFGYPNQLTVCFRSLSHLMNPQQQQHQQLQQHQQPNEVFFVLQHS